MNKKNEDQLRERVVRAAEQALADHNFVSPIDVLQGMQLLQARDIENWRRGRVECLEHVVQGNLPKISRCMKMFRQWAAGRGLRPSETQYMRHGRAKKIELRFSKSGDPGIEKAYRTHYIPAKTTAREQEKLEKKLSQPPEQTVFLIIRDSSCSECGVELLKGSFLYLDAEQPLCLECAGLGELEYLPAGNTALTRRARRHSKQSAVVVRFSRSRKRYERQGILVEPEALRRAEEECELDAAERAEQRARAAKARVKQDAKLVVEMAERIGELFPGCPREEAQAIAARTAVRGSRRIGRTAAGRSLDEEALTLAVVAAIRHRHTRYDELLARGVDRTAARAEVRGQVEEILQAWAEETAEGG